MPDIRIRQYASTSAFVGTRDVLLMVFAHSELPELQKLTQVNRSWANLGRHVLRERIFLELGLHILPTTKTSGSSQNMRNQALLPFLAMIDDTHSVVSGSTALAVCMHGTDRAGDWMDTRDLDIFTPLARKDIVVNYIVTNLDYKVHESTLSTVFGGPGFPEEHNEFPEGTASYTQMTRESEIRSVTRLIGADGQRIDIMESASDSALLPVTQFPLTHLINFITGTSLVVCFPWQTLVHRQSVRNPDAWLDEGKDLQIRYIQRGWPIVDFDHSAECDNLGHKCPHILRSTEDQHSLAFHFKLPAGEKSRRTVSYSPETIWLWGYEQLQTYSAVAQTPFIGHGDLMIWC